MYTALQFRYVESVVARGSYAKLSSFAFPEPHFPRTTRTARERAAANRFGVLSTAGIIEERSFLPLPNRESLRQCTLACRPCNLPPTRQNSRRFFPLTIGDFSQ